MSRTTRLSRPMSVVLAAGVLVGGANVAAYAATGGKFILGHTNKANQATTLTTTGSGPALRLNSRAGSPALSVSNETRIAKLNADKVDGLDSSAFAAAAHNHDDRYYTESEVDERVAGKASLGHVHDDRYYEKSSVDHLFARQRFIETGNGVGNNLNCISVGGLSVGVTNGRGEPVNARFTFFVPGSSGQAYGHIRSDGSIRSSSPNVTSVTQPSTGVYCVQIAGGGFDLESAVATMHVN